MSKKIKNVTIVGGGTSGWFTAAYLSHNTKLNVTIVDKEVGTPVGVGEGTLLGFKLFLEDCGFSESEWFHKIDATYKSGIAFPRFGRDNTVVWHPFILDMEYKKHNSSLYEAMTYVDQERYNELGLFFNISLENLVDLNGLEQGYAMHIDCSKLVQFLQEKLTDKITIIKSDVVEVNRNGNTITGLTLKNGSIIESDLYVDCTGFKQLLQYSPQRVNLTNRLFCDTAVAGHVPYEQMHIERRPFVESCAVDHGWIWKIPVQTRIGTGLVFKRDITSVDEAKEYLCNHWNNRITPDKLKVIDWTPYYNKNMWDGNVVAIGLSGGFIEPLESTGLGTITNAIMQLHRIISPGYYTNSDVGLFNSFMTALYEDAIDFINMHYVYSDIDSKFWQHVKENIIPSQTYLYYKEMIENGDPLNRDGKQLFFGGANWLCWMLQIEKNIGKTKSINQKIADEIITEWEKRLTEIRNNPKTVHHKSLLMGEQ